MGTKLQGHNNKNGIENRCLFAKLAAKNKSWKSLYIKRQQANRCWRLCSLLGTV